MEFQSITKDGYDCTIFERYPKHNRMIGAVILEDASPLPMRWDFNGRAMGVYREYGLIPEKYREYDLVPKEQRIWVHINKIKDDNLAGIHYLKPDNCDDYIEFAQANQNKTKEKCKHKSLTTLAVCNDCDSRVYI